MAEGPPTLYETIGGRAACRRLSMALYARIERDPLLRPLFPGKSFTCAIEEFAAFLAQFLGGPGADAQRRWWLSLRESHLRFRIGQQERDAWIRNMALALDDAVIREPIRSELLSFFKQSSLYVVNDGEVGPHEQDSHIRREEDLRAEISRRWDMQRGMDEVAAAIRGGDTKLALSLVERPLLRNCDRVLLCGLLAMMIKSGQQVLIEYVREALVRNPEMVWERYGGRTLLHEAAGAGSLTVIETLLRLGADPNAQDGGEHAPLYSVGNECKTAAGGDVVRALVAGGAKVNACDGVKKCTALHMAARRGFVAVAEALLDCGADIEARDSYGETPLRRAINCDKVAVAALLIAKGANIHSVGSKRLTPSLAARSVAMRRLMQSPVERV